MEVVKLVVVQVVKVKVKKAKVERTRMVVGLVRVMEEREQARVEKADQQVMMVLLAMAGAKALKEEAAVDPVAGLMEEEEEEGEEVGRTELKVMMKEDGVGEAEAEREAKVMGMEKEAKEEGVREGEEPEEERAAAEVAAATAPTIKVDTVTKAKLPHAPLERRMAAAAAAPNGNLGLCFTLNRIEFTKRPI